MIAVSSHKPGCERHHNARSTWNTNFDFIVYWGPFDPGLAGPTTAFVNCEPFPRIKTLAQFCAAQPGWSAIINADIVLHQSFRMVLESVAGSQKLCAVSARYQFNSDGDKYSRAVVEDMGLDFFAAHQSVWQRMFNLIPAMFRIGHVFWDTWMLGFFLSTYGHQVADLTARKLIFHPRHASSHGPYKIDCRYRDKYLLQARWPITEYAL